MMIDSGTLLEIFLGLSAIGILLAPVVPQRWNPLVLAWVASLAAACILVAAGQALFAGSNFETELWSLPSLGTLRLGLDRLSALFLLVTGLVFLPTSMFSAGYLKRYLRRYSLKAFSVWYLGLFASIVLILVAQDVLSFLLAWELMSIFSHDALAKRGA